MSISLFPEPSTLEGTDHAEGLVNPKVRAQKKVTDFGYPTQHAACM
jgi:hypothetical protein